MFPVPPVSPGVAVGWLVLAFALADRTAAAGAEFWLTHPGGSARFERQAAAPVFRTGAAAAQPVVAIDESTAFQTMDGFGYTLTGGSAAMLKAMSPDARRSVLTELFDTGSTHLGVSYLRLSVGASDLDARVFSYNDLATGQTDPTLSRFDLGPDRTALLPVLREILALQPDLKLMASPWSAPAWMKSNGDSRGGRLERRWFGAYAVYLVKYIEALRQEGIVLDALTVQNEPLNPDNNPSMFMPAEDQAAFIRDHLGPALRAAGLRTRIVCYDHNADRVDYPLTVLGDPGAKAFVEGSAFHLYAGSIEALDAVHRAHPDRSLYFTEQWMSAPANLAGDLPWHVTQVLIGASRHWCRTVLEWNLAADPNQGPHTDRGGCDRCLGALTLDGDRVTRNPAYYVIAHASKFVRPGSVRIASSGPDSLPQVAFRTPGSRTVLIAFNADAVERRFIIQAAEGRAEASLPGRAVGTYVW